MRCRDSTLFFYAVSDHMHDWRCRLCFDGAYCEGPVMWGVNSIDSGEVKPLFGWFQTAWNGTQFIRCPQMKACLGKPNKNLCCHADCKTDVSVNGSWTCANAQRGTYHRKTPGDFVREDGIDMAARKCPAREHSKTARNDDHH